MMEFESNSHLDLFHLYNINFRLNKWQNSKMAIMLNFGEERLAVINSHD